MQAMVTSWRPHKKPLDECCFEFTVNRQDTPSILFSLVSEPPNLPIPFPSGCVVIWHFTAFVKMPVNQNSIGAISNPRIKIDIVFCDELIEDGVSDIETAKI
jgi:hypothetical protein